MQPDVSATILEGSVLMNITKPKRIYPLKTWDSFPEVNHGFLKLGERSTDEDVITSMPIIELFVSLMYNWTTNCRKVNETKTEMFTKNGWDLDVIRPISDPLVEHVRRACLIHDRTYVVTGIWAKPIATNSRRLYCDWSCVEEQHLSMRSQYQ